MQFATNLQHLMQLNDLTKYRLSKLLGVSESTAGNWANGKTVPYTKDLKKIATLFGITVESLIGDELPDAIPISEQKLNDLLQPRTTDDVVTFPVMGTVAAGYDHVIYEDYTDDTVDIAQSALRGHTAEDFFVLRIVGQSMYPQYHEDDLVLILRQETTDYFGQVGVVLYNDDKVTLKRIEYNQEKNQMKLVPINPQCAPMTIKDEDLNHCRILGVPKLLIREIGD